MWFGWWYCVVAMFPRWVRDGALVVTAMFFTLLIVMGTSLVMILEKNARDPTNHPPILLKLNKLKSFMIQKANVLMTNMPPHIVARKPEDKTSLRSMDPVLQNLKRLRIPLTPATVSVEQYLKRLDQDDLEPVPLSSTLDNATVVLNSEDAQQVPNVVHYINFKAPGFKFNFARYVAFRSVQKYNKPALTIVWGDDQPDKTTNKWWARILKEFQNIYYVFQKPVKKIAEKTVHLAEHKSAWLRMRILLDYGGIYLDHDVIVLRPFTDLLKFPVTMGRETHDRISPAIILSAPDQLFLKKWRELYGQYLMTVTEFRFNNLVLNNLADAWALEVHIVNGSFTDPYPHPSPEGYALFCGNYDLKDNYAIHIYRKADFGNAIPQNVEQLSVYNCTLGNAMRTVLYDDPKVRPRSKYYLVDGCITKD